MGYFKWLLAGLIGGAIGGAIWVAVGYFTNFEVGWIAWGIGLLAGMGVRAAAGERDGIGPGAAAVVAALFVVVISKYAVVSLLVDKMIGQLGQIDVVAQFDEEDHIAQTAAQIRQEYDAAGKTYTMPVVDEDDEEITAQTTYPPEIWAEAKARWEGLTDAERQRQTEERKQKFQQEMLALKQNVKQQVFQGSFSPWDLLWLGLATMTAFRVGSGATRDT